MRAVRTVELRARREAAHSPLIRMAKLACYVVPEYSRSDSSHMAHLPRFLQEVAKYCALHVIFQRADARPEIPGAQTVSAQPRGSHPRRALDLLARALHLRRLGCRLFFVRISPTAAFVLGFAGRLLGWEVWYWLSGESGALRPSWRRAPGQWLRWHASQALIWANMRIVQHVATGPERMVDYYVRMYGLDPRKACVLYNDVDVTALRERAKAFPKSEARRLLSLGDGPIVLFVGRVSGLKGGHHLIPFARHLKERSPDAKLVVVGDYSFLPGVVSAAADNGLRNIVFCGPVPNDRLAPYFRAADVFILPSESEGFPRTLLEAMAYGTPVVSFDVGGVRDILVGPQHAYVISRGDLNGMADRVVELLRNPDTRGVLAELGARRVEEFSTETVAASFVQRVLRP